MASQMQIGWIAQRTERVHQGGSLVSDLQLFLGTTGNKDLGHLVLWKWNTWQRFKMHVRLFR
jgi:hypothetical protein